MSWTISLVLIGTLSAGVICAAWLSSRITSQARSEFEQSIMRVDENDTGVESGRRLPLASNRRTVPPKGGFGWPTLLGPCHDGTSPEVGLDLDWSSEGPYEKWRTPVGTGYSSPVALGDALVLLHRREDREVVQCFDPETGRSRWQHSWPAAYRCPYHHSSGPYSSPVLESDRVYALGAAGHLCCLRLADGSEVWHRQLYDDYQVKIEVWPAAASPLVEGDRLILNAGGRKTGAGIVALDKRTGKTLWTATNDGASCSTPRAATIHGCRYAFVWTADALVSLDPESGKVHWRIPFCARSYEAAHGSSPLIADDVVLVSGYQIGNLCVRVRPDGSCQELWRDRRELLDSHYNTLLHIEGAVCGYSTTRRALRCLDILTGEMRWQWQSRIRNGTLVAVDGGHLLLGENGLLASLRITSRGATLRSMTPQRVLTPPSMSYPALHRGLFYLRNEEEMVCVDLRRAAKPE